jgi:UDP-GlcNAc:undecaprenyl-phosphate GlcNAc-1-phosphate transferase
VKIGGQLIGAAALAIDNVGVKLAQGMLLPLAKALGVQPTMLPGDYETLLIRIPLPVPLGGLDAIPIDCIYWIGTGIIAIAVLGLCNASNLIDGLDGLLSGTTAIAATGLLVVALGLAAIDDGPRDAQRVVLCLALLGACLGFLPHNFNPATIFLGDAGSLMMGFCTCAIILSLGDTGKTFLVLAGLVIYAVPIIDTSLAIVRRKMEGKSISSADDQHLHHMLKRALGVKGAVLSLYGIAAAFAAMGAGITLLRARIIYVLAMVLAAFIGVTAIKIARKKTIEAQAAASDARSRAARSGPASQPDA